jgi:hypothetical protein
MAILPGQRLGPYEIFAPAGAGGMGEVEAFWPAITLGGSRQPKSRLPRAKSKGVKRGIPC